MHGQVRPRYVPYVVRLAGVDLPRGLRSHPLLLPYTTRRDLRHVPRQYVPDMLDVPGDMSGVRRRCHGADMRVVRRRRASVPLKAARSSVIQSSPEDSVSRSSSGATDGSGRQLVASVRMAASR